MDRIDRWHPTQPCSYSTNEASFERMRMYNIWLPLLDYCGEFVNGSNIAMRHQRTNQVRSDKHIDSCSAGLIGHKAFVTDGNGNLRSPSEGSNKVENVNLRSARDGSRYDVKYSHCYLCFCTAVFLALLAP